MANNNYKYNAMFFECKANAWNMGITAFTKCLQLFNIILINYI